MTIDKNKNLVFHREVLQVAMPWKTPENALKMKKHSFYPLSLVTFLLWSSIVSGQPSQKTDSIISDILKESTAGGQDDHGLMLIKSEKYEEASSFFSKEISKDASDRDAYFKRGVSNWHLNDSLSACRDWSAVLALGDTATYLLLQKNCHGNMVFEDDTVSASRARKLFIAPQTSSAPGYPTTFAKTIVQEMPEFPGGEAGLIDYFNKNVHYPNSAKEKGIQGRVYINFIISKTGKVMYPYVVRGIGGDCDKEALRVIRQMPNWKPGKEQGKAVLVRYNLPVKFTMQ